MKYPEHVWVDPAFADEPLERLRREYLEYLRGRPQPASEGTVDKYSKTLKSFMDSLTVNSEPLVLGSLTVHAVNRWIREQRTAGRSKHTIASRLSALKAFANKYIYDELTLTRVDLLAKVSRMEPADKPFVALTEDDVDTLLDCFDRPTHEDVRNRAMIAVFVSTGLRFSEVLNIEMSKLDQISREVRVLAKGRRERPVCISPGAWKHVSRYLKRRQDPLESGRLWLTGEGKLFTKWAAYAMFRRLKERSEIDIHPHLFRHSFAQNAIYKGAERAAVQDMLGHKTDKMARRYAGAAREETAARMMPKYSVL